MKQGILVVVLLVVIGAGYFVFVQDTEAPAEVVEDGLFDPNQILSSVNNNSAVLLDVRTIEERESDGYAVNSTHFDVGLLRNGELPEIDQDVSVYVYCRSGGRAEEAKEILESNGFTDVTNIGGLTDWIEAGGEIVQ